MTYFHRDHTEFLSTPSARRATGFFVKYVKPYVFLSTPSARRATSSRCSRTTERRYFYPRPPRGGRPSLVSVLTLPHEISIHALREEGDEMVCNNLWERIKFLSTPSARRATKIWQFVAKSFRISIHALREEGDSIAPIAGTDLRTFLSTPSARRATPRGLCNLREFQISIHALREEGDSKNGEKHLRFCFIIKRSAQIWKSLSKNIRKKSRDLHRMP